MLSEVNINFSSDFSGIRDTASKEMKKNHIIVKCIILSLFCFKAAQ